MTARDVASGQPANLGDRLSNRFFLVTLAAFIAVGIPAYLYLVSAVKGQFIQNYSDFSVNTAAQSFAAHLERVPGGAFNEPLEGRQLDEFLLDVQRQVESNNLLKVKVWRPDGMLLYSSTGTGVGSVRELDHHFLDAIKQGAFTEVENDEPEVAGEESVGQVLEIYLPAYGPDGQVVNLFELYYSLAPLNSAIGSMRTTLLVFLAALFVVVVAVAQLGARLLVRRNQQLQRMSDELARLAVTDGLTGLTNHRHFYDRLVAEVEASKRYARDLSLVMIDLDFFKRVNDEYGHQTGDVVLREAARALSGAIRNVDVMARYGGEEFALLMPETTEPEAALVAERLRSILKEIAVSVGDDTIGVTASFGVAQFPSAAMDPESLVAAADSALYFAKKTGRNRVCAFSALTPGSADDIDVERLFNRLRHAGLVTVQALAAAVNGPDTDGVHDHKGSVDLAVRAAGALDLSATDSEALTLAASVYDIGKIAVPSAALSKPEALTAEELRAIQVHPETSEKILTAVGGLERVLAVVKHHHERYDGRGYPSGLKGDEIPYLSRVLHVIDAYLAMTTDRPYRKALGHAEAIAELRANAGTQFDPMVVGQLIVTVLKEPRRRAQAA